MRAIIIVTGDPGRGKTTWLLNLTGELRDSGLSVAGIASPSIPGYIRSYYLMNIDSGNTIPLATETQPEGWEKSGRFCFNPAAISLGNEILRNPGTYNNDLVVVDEVGLFELEGRIWADAITTQRAMDICPILWVVRKNLVEEVISKWDLKKPVILDIEKCSVIQGRESILSGLRR